MSIHSLEINEIEIGIILLDNSVTIGCMKEKLRFYSRLESHTL